MIFLSRQLQLIRYAVMFYTRIPVGSLQQYDQSIDDHATRYFTLIGWLLGALTALAFYVASQALPHTVAVVLSMLFGIWLTGAFHEDGLADTCDGIGGGWTQERILDIMKDSRVGTYGLVGLGFALALKALLLVAMPGQWVIWALLAGHVLSRWSACVLMFCMRYVRLDETSKAKPVTKGFSAKDFLIASAFCLPVLLLLPPFSWWAVFGMLPPAWYLAAKLKTWLGGYTGDTLGAMQQVTEIGFYLALLALI
jgi:adenosylcobinamide-GDP ribazoletransferase